MFLSVGHRGCLRSQIRRYSRHAFNLWRLWEYSNLQMVQSFSTASANRNIINMGEETCSQDLLSFDDYDAFGFDLDHTLAHYNIPNLFNLVYDSLARYLVEQKGYDQSLLRPFDLDKDFVTRGLVLEIDKGNFLKLGEDGTILRASHGTRFLTDEEIVQQYGEKRQWSDFTDLIEKVDNPPGNRIFENFYDMPGSLVAARIVDLIDKSGPPPEKYDIWPDMIATFTDCYRQQAFSEDTGGFFPAIKRDPHKYIYPVRESVKQWLVKAREHNKTIFILTSSFIDFAQFSLQHIFGPDWKSYFDLYIFNARKPGFFTNNRHFLRTEGHREKEPVLELEIGGAYSQGNQKALLKFLAKVSGKQDPKVLFFGDSNRSDIYPSKKYANWETLLILEEMAADVPHPLIPKPDGSEEPSSKKKKLEEPTDELDYLRSNLWGSFFTDGPLAGSAKSNVKTMNTLWGYIVRRYADVSVPHLETITDLPYEHKFTVFNHNTRRQWGFYPNVPASLRDTTGCNN